MRPQTIKVKAAPCQIPLIKNVSISEQMIPQIFQLLKVKDKGVYM